MFAVPGWSISADKLKVETYRKEPSNKKRKRSVQDNEPIDASQIGDLWKNHVEVTKNDAKQQTGERRQSISKKEKKRTKHSSLIHTDAIKDPEVGIEYKNRSPQVGIEIDHGKGVSHGTTVETSLNEDRKKSDIPKNKDEQKPQREKKDKLKLGGHNEAGDTTENPSKNNPTHSVSAKAAVKLTPLQVSMRQKLISSRFRHLNETLYTTPSVSSLELFKTNPEFFNEYHEGFRRQVEAWPQNPVDSFLRWIEERGPVGIRNYKEMRKKTSRKPAASIQGISESTVSPEAESLPRDPRKGTCAVADLGCGDGKLGLELTRSGLAKKLKLKVCSFDLVSAASHVEVADIRSLPLEDSSIDVTIFCLALMGTNWIEFIEEAYRALRWKGECWIAEVTSRFGAPKSTRVEHSVGNKIKAKQKKKMKQGSRSEQNEDDSMDLGLLDDAHSAPQSTADTSAFVAVLRRRGFILQGAPQTDNKMFVQMRFVKALVPRRGKGIKKQNPGGKKRFIEDADDDDDITVEDEAKVLKPCVYKVR